MRPFQRRRPGLTLMEVMVVLVILVALAAILVPLVGEQSSNAKDTVARSNLALVRDAFARYRTDNPFKADGSALTPDQIRIDDLFHQNLAKNWDPVAKVGWHGPYLLNSGAVYTIDTNFTAS